MFYQNILEVKKTCQKCRGCCHSVKIAFKKDSEGGRLLENKYQSEDWPTGHDFYEVEGHPEFWVYRSNKNNCMFLDDKTYSCTIHEIKPIVCKMFPLKWDNEYQYYIDLCPLSFVIPLKQIYLWKKGHEQEIKGISYYVNPRQSEHLLPISQILDTHKNFNEVLFQ